MKITTKKDYGYNWIRGCHTPSPKTLSWIIGIISSSPWIGDDMIT
ncbi:MAG TPA: hypothetical protein VIP70_08035 [Nitrososphaeraceae archaeon]